MTKKRNNTRRNNTRRNNTGRKNTRRNNTRKLTKRRTSKKTPIKMNMSEKTYNKLLDMKKNKKTLSKSQQRNLDKALHIKYCMCVKSLKYSQKNKGAYGICANSVYKNRGIDMPFRAAINCKKYKK